MATVTNQTQLRSALQTGADPEVLVANNITVTTYLTVNRSVTIRSVPGNPTATLFWSPPATGNNKYLFRIYSSGNVTMDTLTLDAQGRDGGLVRLSGGTFTMNDGVTITGVKSNTANSAVLVGDMTSTVGGTFIMNGGLMTGVDAGPHTVVFCAGGTVIMGGNAAIENNPSAGLTTMHNIVDNTRSTVRITENARIANNTSGQSGAGILHLHTDAVIGENENDAPQIIGNSSPFNAGGIVALEAVNLTIGGRTEISGNSARLSGGGIVAQSGSAVHIGGDVKVQDNRCGSGGGGLCIVANATAVLEGGAEISGNIAGDETIPGGAGVGDGGGVMLQTGARLEIKGTVAVNGNTARNGGGIYLLAPPDGSAYAAPTAVIGAEDSAPSVFENTAEGLGGGIFIADPCTATLTGQASVYNNVAVDGKGVYNDGIFKVADSPKILDGLFFDCVPADSFGGSPHEEFTEKIRIQSDDPGFPGVEYDITVHAAANAAAPEADGGAFTDAPGGFALLDCDKAPIIEEALTAEAEMHVELSAHVALLNVPLVIATGGTDALPLIENDRAAWRIPSEFDPGYAVMLTPELDQVIIDAVRYRIVYNDLFGATSPNPESYTIRDLPITFAPPGERKGYAFTEWRDTAGNPAKDIPKDTTGDLTFAAVWQAQVYTIVYDDLYGTTCPNPTSYNVENLPILLAAPSQRLGYAFTEWRDAAGNAITEIPEDTTGNLTYVAVWQAEVYTIVYEDLYGTTCPNPTSYNVENLPILLAAPSQRLGYAFTGWRDAAGSLVTEVPEDTTGNLTFAAVWQALAYDIAYLNLFEATHTNPASYNADILPILLAAPGERPGYTFIGWRDAVGNPVTEIPLGTTGDLTFIAVWHAEVFNIVYLNLFETPHPNPASYNADILPILLAAPGERPGYTFIGWRDAVGNPVTEIPLGTIGNLTFIALWTELSLSFDGNASCACHVPETIRAGGGTPEIPCARPCRPCHVFVGWNESPSGSGRAWCPGDSVEIAGKSVTLYAQWRFVGCCRCPPRPRRR